MSLDNNLILSIPMFIVETEYSCPLFWPVGRPSQLRAGTRSPQLLCVPTFPGDCHTGLIRYWAPFLFYVMGLSCHFLTALSLGRRVSIDKEPWRAWVFCQQVCNYNSFMYLYHFFIGNSVPSSFWNSEDNCSFLSWIAVRKSMEDVSAEIWRSLPSTPKPSPDSHYMDRTPTVPSIFHLLKSWKFLGLYWFYKFTLWLLWRPLPSPSYHLVCWEALWNISLPIS